MSELLTDKDKMIAYLIAQVNDLQIRLNDSNKRALELATSKQEQMLTDQPISLSQLQSLVQGNIKPMSNKTEEDIKKAVDLIVNNKSVFGF